MLNSSFTIKEDEPLEKEVAVDPEMLGKVFENLLEVNDRKSKGAFYTPRQIVHDICQNCLISYLESNSNISREDLNIFIKKGHLAIDSIIRVNEEKEKYNGKQFSRIELPDSIKENSDELDELLKKVKIVDPAVGSGAFPVGMMNEIINARYILHLLNDKYFNIYDLKKETISNSLYGVDIEQSAIDITKLRFWLSLIVDEESADNIKPLPNLDNQIVCGNSLIDTYKGIKLFDNSLTLRSPQRKLTTPKTEEIFYEIEKFKKEYFNTNGPNKKKELKNKINNLKLEFIKQYLKNIKIEDNLKRNEFFKKKNLKNLDIKKLKKDLFNEIRESEDINLKPFIWELEFSEIFVGKNPGFDIVIGNPPYVRQEKIKEIKPILKEQFLTYKGSADLYVYFYEKGLNLLKNGGILSFITSNKYTKSDYGKKLRKFLLNNYIELYIDYNNTNIFENVSVDTSIIQIIKKEENNNNILVNNEFLLNQKCLNTNGFYFLKPGILKVMEKITQQGILLKNINKINIFRGVTTGYNDAFIIDEKAKKLFNK